MAGVPAAVAVAAKAVGTYFATHAAVAAIAKFVAYSFLSYEISKRTASFDPGIQSRAITTRGTVEPQQKIYGETLVSGPMFFINTAGADNYQLHLGVLLAAHEVEEISDVWFDDRVIKYAWLGTYGNSFYFVASNQSWTASGATLTTNAAYSTLTSSGTDPLMRRTLDGGGLYGSSIRYVRARVRRTAGAGWQGDVFYVTGGHSESTSYYARVSPDPTVTGEWVDVVWDMWDLAAGGTDWYDNLITALRLDLGNSASDVFDVESVELLAPGGGVIQGDASSDWVLRKGAPMGAIWKHDGADDQAADSELQYYFPSLWTTNHRLRGNAYLIARLDLFKENQAFWDAGEPTNIRAMVKGARLYDPRKDTTEGGSGSHRWNDSTTWEWSDNPALEVADFLMDTAFGYRVDGSRIVWASVADAADYCDELVDVPGGATEKRYVGNGMVYGTAKRSENLAAILSAFNGDAYPVCGKWRIDAGYIAPDADNELDADDLDGPIAITTARDRQERYNRVTAAYVDKDRRYQPATSPVVTSAALLSKFGAKEFDKELQLTFTDSFNMVQRLLWQRLNVDAQEQTVRMRTNLAAVPVGVGERFNFTVDELSWNPNALRLGSFIIQDAGGEDGLQVELEARVDSASAWDDLPVANYTTRSAADELAPGDLGVAIGSSLTLSSVPGGVHAAWSNPTTGDFDTVRVWFAPSSAWSGAVEVWSGYADEITLPWLGGDTVYAWVTWERRGDPQDPADARFPDSDTSTISAVAGLPVGLANLLPQGYGDFERITNANLSISYFTS